MGEEAPATSETSDSGDSDALQEYLDGFVEWGSGLDVSVRQRKDPGAPVP